MKSVSRILCAAALLLFVATEHGAAALPAQAPAAPAVTRTTPHLSITASVSPGSISPGARLELVIDIVPKKGMHVYAPGGDSRPVAISLAPHRSLQFHDTVYPKATLYKFEPTHDEWLVYAAPFRLEQEIIVGDAAALKAEIGGASKLSLKGELQYQACDDSVCYLPVSVPLVWNLPVKR